MSYSLPAENVFLDLSDRAKLRLTGADRVRFLNGQVSNDVRLATADEAIYTGVMTIKGKLCADAFVHAEPDALLLDADGDLRESLATRLEKYIIADDVQIEDATETLGLCHLLNFREATPPTLPDSLSALGSNVRGVRSTRFGRPGLDVFFVPAQEEALHAAIHHAGYTLLNDDALESLRILLGVPNWGAELDENVLPAEAGIEDRAVSFTKGCYIGQEVVSRVRSVGHVNRHLCGLRATDASPLYAGMLLYAADDAGGKMVGRITSAAPSAGHGGAEFVALGYVRRELAAPGTALDAVLPPETVSAQEAAESLLDEAAPPALPGGSCRATVRAMIPAVMSKTRRWLPLLLCWIAATASLSASTAVIHFQTTETKDDQVVTIQLFDADAPATVENFKKLALKKFYNGMAVHRVVPETLVQMGDPFSRKNDRSQTGTGGPGYTLPSEIRRKHARGAVAMAALPPALNPARVSNGSQFYVTLRPQPELDKDYTVFGQVTGGLEFLDSISRRGRDTNDYPLERVVIRSIEIK